MPRGARPGERRGGRAKGTLNKRTDEQVRAIRESGLTPLDYILQVLRNSENSMELRLDAATRAAPYVHARLAVSTIDINAGRTSLRELTDEQLQAIVERGLADEGKGDGDVLTVESTHNGH